MNFLDKLDQYYNSRKPTDAWMIVLLFALVTGYLAYTFLSPITSEYRKTQENRNADLKHKINSAKNYLSSITVNGDRDYKVKELDRQIVKKRRELNEYRAKVTKLNSAMTQLQSVLYTKDNWSKFLHNIAIKAKENNLKVDSITNTILDQNQTFGKVLDIDIKCKGEYGDILSFMNEIEKTKLVSVISSVELNATDNNPQADIKFSVWGIKP